MAADGTPGERLVLEGHVIDSLLLAKVLDIVVAAGADYRLVEVDIGRTAADASRVVVDVVASGHAALAALVEQLEVHGANLEHTRDAELVACTDDGVAPDGFHVTTALATHVRVGGRWHGVADPAAGCALVVLPVGGGPAVTARTVPLHRLTAGDLVVAGRDGVRVDPTPPRPRTPGGAADVAGAVRQARSGGSRVLAACGPAVIRSGAGPHLARLVRADVVDVVVAGNDFAVADLADHVASSPGEAASPADQRAHHLRTVNEIRRWGSVEAAVHGGRVTGGVLRACHEHRVPLVLAGSLSDTGPLPDVVTDTVSATDAVRDQLPGVAVALLLASESRATAVASLLPATVTAWYVDLDAAAVGRVVDHGGPATHGVVTDVEPFLRDLADELGA